MAVETSPARIREFTDYLHGLLAWLDPSEGWCAVFWHRDPDGMRAWLDGREVPPRDVVEALLQDLRTARGPGAAASEAPKARGLHAAALLAHDARPGAREDLADRLDVMLREQKYAAERYTRLNEALARATGRAEADALGVDLAWARDDHDRAAARCAELRDRAAALDRRARRTAPSAPVPVPDMAPVPDAVPGSGAAPGREAVRRDVPAPAGRPAPAPERRTRRRRGSARFAGVTDEAAAPVVVPPAVTSPESSPSPGDGPASSPAAAPATRIPRGARFAGAVDGAEEERAGPGPGAPGEPWAAGESVGAAERQEVARCVGALARLRRDGRSGEAHALLAEAASWPAARLPLLADGMRGTGLDADWTTLLWEAASLPMDRLVAAADALTAAGRTGDAERLLRQGVVRPAEETGRAVLALAAEDRHREVRTLLDAHVRTRTPEEAARSAAPGPERLVPLLLGAARDVSQERYRDLLHALRVAGFTT
ncbi:hypothetical protein [Streptomyces prasinus]|uniref:hypothetical protein n=1 Tax=Streptomyces prasinus TaxID=67345 RepID=UPI002F417CBD